MLKNEGAVIEERFLCYNIIMRSEQPIAVVGMSGVFPGANELSTFWQNIINCVETVDDVPIDRWGIAPQAMLADQNSPDKAYSRRACLIQGFQFDPSGLTISPALVRDLDPLYHLVLHAGRQALAGSVSPDLSRDRIGVTLAALVLPTQGASDVARRIVGQSIADAVEASIEASTGPSIQASGDRPPANRIRPLNDRAFISGKITSLPAALLAEALGLGGGTLTLDAACASSLYAIKLACDELNGHRVDAMLAGGVSRPDCLYTQVGFSQLHALSPSGRCAPFDKTADGLVVGEGVGIVMLKRLEDALAAGDEIHGIIKGIGLSNDLRGNLLAPSSEGQIRAMQQAYQMSGWSPQDIDLIECHGAGTPLGDSTELSSLKTLWDQAPPSHGTCAIGSVKSMIGHLLTGAAAAGLIKTLLAIKNHTLPPSINFHQPPVGSPLHDGPFKVQTEAKAWHQRNGNTPRRAAINAFGFGGINAHLLVEEYMHERPASQPVRQSVKQSANRPTGPPIAIVGMDASFGRLTSLDSFSNAVFKGESAILPRPETRWKGCDNLADTLLGRTGMPGAFMDQIQVQPGEFRIPPAEIVDILPQHLLMLKTACRAAHDAGLALDTKPRVGSIIGIDFDFEATNFHLRWDLFSTVKRWNDQNDLGLSDRELDEWRQQLQKIPGPRLTHERTLGALGSMVVSRVARELRLGGPSFVISDGPASGLRALEIGIRSVQLRETDAMLIGAVDLFGDVRNMVMAAGSGVRFSMSDTICPFHPAADGTLPGEGAGAVVIKRLEDALTDNNRIYAVIHGLGTSTGNKSDPNSMVSAYSRSIGHALDEAGWDLNSLGFLEVHGSGDPAEDAIETTALTHLFPAATSKSPSPCFLGTTKTTIGYTGAAASMAALIQTACSLFQRKVVPWATPTDIDTQLIANGSVKFADQQTPWHLAAESNHHRAGVIAMTPMGGCTCVALESYPEVDATGVSARPLSSLSPYDDKADYHGSNTAQPITLIIGGLRQAPLPPPIKPAKTTAPASTTPATISDLTPEVAIIRQLAENTAATEKIHKQFLEFSADMTRITGDTLTFQNEILTWHPTTAKDFMALAEYQPIGNRKPDAPHPKQEKPAFSRKMCMEFAIGSVARVFGSTFSDVDTYPARVRLPDEPLMLVDRIVAISGRKGRLGPGRIITEHDVNPKAWYLDNDRVPVCISVEAGQADLFLCAYLGIDFKVKGKRTYRLLDATVTFHDALPRSGDVIRYDIRIDKFVRQGDTYLFFFRFEGTISGRPFITMTDGCAGFFTDTEVNQSGGIITTDKETAGPGHPEPGQPEPSHPKQNKNQSQWGQWVPVNVQQYSDAEIDALRQGDMDACFGESFSNIKIPTPLRLPGGRMRLIDRVLHLDPAGGKYHLGFIQTEADIHPDDWFLTCHFVDDQVMPGTLMYECCAHTLRVFLQRMGWICDHPAACYEPVIGIKSILKCRGPVTAATRKVRYELTIRKVGYKPEPYVIGDADMFADGRHIVRFSDISMKISGVTRSDLQKFWDRHTPRLSPTTKTDKKRSAVYNRQKILAIAQGNPSEAFGKLYLPFDTDRFIARLPRPPYLFIDQISRCDPPPWIVKPGGWIEADYQCTPDSWYFFADRTGYMPYAVLLEIALQPCGWLASYVGSALLSDDDLRFRNLGGQGIIQQNISTGHHTLTTRVRLTHVSRAAGMIVETFDFEVFNDSKVIYEGDTYFGYFPQSALAQQEGIRDAKSRLFQADLTDSILSAPHRFADSPPLTPIDTAPIDDLDSVIKPGETQGQTQGQTHGQTLSGLQMPASAMRMIDQIDILIPDGGPCCLGYIRATKRVDPGDWFFKAHFYQDPVWPGSLGLESFIQILKFYILTIWKDKVCDHQFSITRPQPHQWIYRGQILPSDKMVTVEAVITRVDTDPVLSITADGFLSVDGRYIYEMKQFGIELKSPASRSTP